MATSFELMEIEEEKELNISDWPLLELYFDNAEAKISEILLQISLLVRTYDDQMKNSRWSDAYLEHASLSNGEDYIGSLNEDPLPLREACNKIIHAAEVRPLFERVDRTIIENNELSLEQDIWYLTGELELTGQLRGKSWKAELIAQHFVEVILDRIAFGYPEEETENKE